MMERMQNTKKIKFDTLKMRKNTIVDKMKNINFKIETIVNKVCQFSALIASRRINIKRIHLNSPLFLLLHFCFFVFFLLCSPTGMCKLVESVTISSRNFIH